MNVNEAVNELKKLQNVFKATETLVEVLQEAAKAQGQLRSVEQKVSDSQKQLDQANEEAEKAKERVVKANQDADKRVSEVQETTNKKIAQIRQDLANEKAQADASRALLENTKKEIATELAGARRSHQEQMDAMKAEYQAMKTQLSGLTSAADEITKKISQVGRV